MKLRFQFRRYRLPFRATVRTAHGLWAEREGLIVRLEDVSEGGSGVVAYGEAAPIPWFGTETVEAAEQAAQSLGEWIESESLDAIPETLPCLRHALAAAREQLTAVVQSGASEQGLNSAAAVPYLPVAALLPAGKVALQQIEPKVEVGFRVFKWKVGVGDIADELGLLDDVCARLPEGSKLRLDANGAWDRRRAERWLERCADRPIEFVEQPVAAEVRGARDTLLGLASDYPTPVALDESLISARDVETWLGAGWPGVFVVKPLLLGNVTETLARLMKAKADVVFSSALETAVGAQAALRVAFLWAARTSAAAVPAPTGGKAVVATGATPAAATRRRALGFGVWPLFTDARFDGPALAPFVRWEDVGRMNSEAAWNALS